MQNLDKNEARVADIEAVGGAVSMNAFDEAVHVEMHGKTEERLCASEFDGDLAQAIWEDRLDAMGSEPPLEDLRALLIQAPNPHSALYSFAQTVYEQRLAEEEAIWEDKLDAAGMNASLEDLNELLSCAPNRCSDLYVFLVGVIAQRTIAAIRGA